jgi:hypothetical protein
MFRLLWMKIKVIYKDHWSFWLTNSSILFVLATWFFYFFTKINPSPIASLHYNIYSGIDLLGDWHWLVYLPLILLFLSLANFIIATVVFTKRPAFSHFILAYILCSNAMFFTYYFYILNYNLNA